MRPKHQRQIIENKLRNERLSMYTKELERNNGQMNYLQKVINNNNTVSKNDVLILCKLKNKYYHYENRAMFLQNKIANIQCHFL